MKTFSEKKLSIEKITGSLGDVMKESVTCALTVAWNILPQDIKDNINNNKDGIGLHIHCGDSQQKDGPSAGLCITTAIISRITNIPIRNEIAMTGEINLLGQAQEIGGLHSKLMGAYNSGIKKVLIPKDNEKDLDLIFKKENEDETIEMKKIKSMSSIVSTPSTPFLMNSFTFDEMDTYQSNNKYNKKIFFRNEVEIVIVDNIFDVLKHALVENNIVFNKDF